MRMKHLRTRPRARLGASALAAIAMACISMPWMDGHAQSNPYTMNWDTITAGGIVHMRSSCYQLAGSIDFLSPGVLYSVSGNYTVFTGFWVAAPIAGQDEIFFDGFEECN